MSQFLERFQGWDIFAEEVSANVYKVKAIGPNNETIEKTDSMLEELIAECKQEITIRVKDASN